MRRVFVNYLGNSIEITAGETLVGRDLTCAMRFNDSSVSRKHFRIEVDDDGVFGQDLGSRNGTTLNGEPVKGRVRLTHGDRLTLGTRRLKVQIDRGDADWLSEQPTDTNTLEIAEESIKAAEQLLATGAEQRCPSCRGQVAAADAQCATCGYLWPEFRPGTPTQKLKAVTQAEIDDERRTHRRHRVRVPVLYNSDNLTVETLAIDLSRSGVFVRSQILDELGTACRLTMMIDGAPALSFEGRVSRVVETPDVNTPLGFAIEFTDVDNRAARWLEDTIERFLG